MRGRPEARIRLGCRDLLRSTGFAVWDLEQNRRTRQTPGLGDLYALGHGLSVWIEVKTPKGKLSTAQEVFRDFCLENGQGWQLWRSVGEAWEWLVAEGIVDPAYVVQRDA
jgi:hypothetical protein